MDLQRSYDKVYDMKSDGIVETTETTGTIDASGILTDLNDYIGIPIQDISSERTLNSQQTALQKFISASSKDDRLRYASSSSVSPVRRQTLSQSPPSTNQHSFKVFVPPPKFLPLPYASSRSGLVYDVRMRFHEFLFLADEEAHPEVPARIASIFNDLVDAGLAPDPQNPDRDSEHQLVRILIRPATEHEILLVHSDEHLHWVKSLAGLSIDDLKAWDERLNRKNSVYVHNNTWLCASLAAGGAIEAANAVVTGQVRNSIALIRPPGHHAEHGAAEGFCFFNNVCIAARVMQQQFPDNCRKILILDWDVHHGNGIQRDFYDNPNVLYISLHVHNGGYFYPLGDYGDHYHCGEGKGLGRNVNIPWTKEHMGDAEYMYAFQQIVMPIAVEFNPDLVFISAGFDAADGDPLGACHVSPACYGHMTHMLMQLAKGRIVSCLEGGYNLQAIAKSALAMTRVMMGEPPDRMAELQPTELGINDVHKVIRMQAKFWKCMYPKDRELTAKKNLQTKRMHDIIREWQTARLWNEHYMTPLFVLRDKLSKSFENQVLATQDYYSARPLLVIFHDPPEAKGVPNPRTNDLELHNTWLTDVSKRYLDWAVKQGFAVIDVNIPKHITQVNDTNEYEESDKVEVRAQLTKELAHYLWQNYIETGQSTQILLLGIGDPYVGIVNLFSENDNVSSQVDLTVAFVADKTLRAVNRRTGDPALGQFYKRSLVYLAANHPAFAPDRRLKKKHGRVIQSPYINSQDMMDQHFKEVTGRMLEVTAPWRENRREEDNTSEQKDFEEVLQKSSELDVHDDGGIRDAEMNGAMQEDPLTIDRAGDLRFGDDF